MVSIQWNVKYKNKKKNITIITYFHRKSDENRMTNSTKIEQTAIIADVCSIELFLKLASKFWKKNKIKWKIY